MGTRENAVKFTSGVTLFVAIILTFSVTYFLVLRNLGNIERDFYIFGESISAIDTGLAIFHSEEANRDLITFANLCDRMYKVSRNE